VVLRLVDGVTVSLDGHYSTDYCDHSAPCVTLAKQPAYPSLGREPHSGSGVARIAITRRLRSPSDPLHLDLPGSRLIREVYEALAAPYDSQPEPQVAGQDARLLSHSADLPHHLVTVGMFYGQDLGFDINRLTVSASVANSYWECNSPASLTRFPCKLDLMPIRHGLCNELRQG
jgi:hypothetical protein